MGKVTMISVITLTTRPEGLKIVQDCLQKQTFKDFEWIVSSPQHVEIKGFKIDQLLSDPPKNEKDVWTYNKALNKAIKQATGDSIVFYQDNIWIPSDALEKLVFWNETKGNDWCITGIGDIYLQVDKWGKPLMKVWSDPRKKDYKEAYEVNPEDWEMNFAFCPRKLLLEIGGADEKLDEYFGMDNISICERLDQLGYRFWIDQSLEIRGIFHERNSEWDKKHAMHGAYEKIKQEWIERKIWPRLPYLNQK